MGVPGSKGKSTTSRLITPLRTAVGRPNLHGGNIGVPVLDMPADAEQYVLELSSFQLHWTYSMAARSAAVLNIAPDHLDWHGSVAAYAADVIAGSPLTSLSLLGPNPGLGVRFYGIGNELEALLAVPVAGGGGAGPTVRPPRRWAPAPAPAA